MTGTVAPALRRLVQQRSGGRREYCRYPQAFALLPFEIEHIVARKHGGRSTADNLALACCFCNRNKGSDLGSLDPETGILTPFFHPRTQIWRSHFHWAAGEILPLSAEARVTVLILQMNSPERIAERRLLAAFYE